MSASVISSCDTPPILEASEHILDFMALFIEDFIILYFLLPVFLWWNTRRDALIDQCLPEPIGVISFVGQQMPGSREIIDEQGRSFKITYLSGGQM